MKHWIIPADTKRYKLEDAIKQLHEIDWRQHNNFEIGDVVYIYCSKPICGKDVKYETKVCSFILHSSNVRVCGVQRNKQNFD